jgi:hypothetical protein
MNNTKKDEINERRVGLLKKGMKNERRRRKKKKKIKRKNK